MSEMSNDCLNLAHALKGAVSEIDEFHYHYGKSIDAFTDIRTAIKYYLVREDRAVLEQTIVRLQEVCASLH